MINKTLAILAGGQSSRMNYNNKAFLNYKGKSFIEHLISIGDEYKEVIIIANNQELYKEFNLRIIKDIYIGNGPLSGIHSALVNATTDKVLCIACDMPLINKDIIKQLGEYEGDYDVLVPKVNNRLQPLCSVYSTSIIKEIEEKLKKNENKLQKLITEVDYKIIERFEDHNFKNVNTPDEYKVLNSKNK